MVWHWQSFPQLSKMTRTRRLWRNKKIATNEPDRYIIFAFATRFPQQEKNSKSSYIRGRSGSPHISSWIAKCWTKYLTDIVLCVTSQDFFFRFVSVWLSAKKIRIKKSNKSTSSLEAKRKKKRFLLLLSMLLFQMWVSTSRKREKRSDILAQNNPARRMRISYRLMAIEKWRARERRSLTC